MLPLQSRPVVEDRGAAARFDEHRPAAASGCYHFRGGKFYSTAGNLLQLYLTILIMYNILMRDRDLIRHYALFGPISWRANVKIGRDIEYVLNAPSGLKGA